LRRRAGEPLSVWLPRAALSPRAAASPSDHTQPAGRALQRLLPTGQNHGVRTCACQCRACPVPSLPRSTGIIWGLYTAAVVRDPAANHPTSVRRPADFDAFWADIMATAARIPLGPSVDAIAARSTEAVEVFEIGYDSLDGVRIAGWYCVPRREDIPPPYPE